MKYLYLFSTFIFLSCQWFGNNFFNHEEVHKKKFWDSPEENLKPTVWDVGDTTVSNEDRYDLFQNYITNLKGGYFGVGSIQNFTFSAWAKSEWVWLMDFTKIVVASNKIHIAFLKKAKTPKEFRYLWSKKGKVRAYQIIDSEFLGRSDHQFIRKTWKVAHYFLQKRFLLLDKLTQIRKYTTWLHDLSDYKHLRQLAFKKKIRALHGDLNGDTTVQYIAKAAKEMKVKIRVIYFSNAEEYLKFKSNEGYLHNGYSAIFRKNWLAIPIDQKSVVIRTISVLKGVYKWPEGSDYSTNRGFHYNIMSGKIFKEHLSHKGRVGIVSIMKTSKNFGKEGYSVSQ